MQKIKRTQKQLINNVIASGMYQILIMIVPIITTPYVTRIFLPEQMGQYSITLAVANIFVILANAGMPLYGSRDIAQSRNESERNKKFNILWNTQIINTLFFSIIYLGYVYFFTDRNFLYIFQVGLIIVSSIDISWFYIGIESIKKNIFRNLISKIFVTIAIFIFVKDRSDLILYTLLNILGIFLGNISMFIGVKKYLKIKLEIPFDFFKIIKNSYSLMYTQLIASIQSPTEKSILNTLSKSTESVGIYDQGIKIINLIYSVINSVINAIMPRMSFEFSEGNIDKVKKYSQKVMELSFIFSVFAIPGIYNVADYFVLFFFGSGYEQVAIVLKITCLSLFFTPISAFMSNGILIPLKKDKIAVKSVILITGTSIVLNILLDSWLKIYGISIAFVVSGGVGFIYRFIYTYRYFNLKKWCVFTVVSMLMITLNVHIVNIFKDIVIINNSLLASLTFGLISVLINGLIIVIIYLIVKISKNRKLFEFFKKM